MLLTCGAAGDHTVDPALPESCYLNAQTIAMDGRLARLGGGRRRGLAQGQQKAEQGTVGAGTLQPNVAAVGTHDVVRDGEPEARAALARRAREGPEDVEIGRASCRERVCQYV